MNALLARVQHSLRRYFLRRYKGRRHTHLRRQVLEAIREHAGVATPWEIQGTIWRASGRYHSHHAIFWALEALRETAQINSYMVKIERAEGRARYYYLSWLGYDELKCHASDTPST